MGSGVSIPVGVQDKASGPIDKIRDRFDTLGKSGGVKSMAQGFGMGAGLAVFGMATQAISGVVDAMGGMVQGAIDDAESVGRLQKTLDNSAPAWRANADAIDERIAAGQKLAFTDDAMRDSLGALTTRTGDVTKAMDLQRLAMDLARAKGLDLETAAKVVGKVYSGNIGVLNRFGIAVDKGATSTEALAKIQEMAGGQAEQYGKSTKGSMESLGIAIGEVGESLGAALLPLLESLVPILRDKLVPLLSMMATVFGGVLAALSPLISFIVDVAIGAFTTMATVVLTAGETLLGVAEAIPGPWQEGAGAIKDSLTKMKEDLAALSASGTSIAEDVGPNVGGALAAGSGDVEEGTDELLEPLDSAEEKMATDARKAAYAATRELASGLQAGWDEVGNAGDALANAMKNPMEREARIAALHGKLASKELSAGLRSNDPLVREAAYKLRDTINDELDKLEYAAKTGGGNVAQAFGDGMVTAASISYARRHAAELAHAVSDYFKGESPPKVGPLHLIDKWGENVGRAWSEGLLSGAAGRLTRGPLGSLGDAVSGLTVAAPVVASTNLGLGGGLTFVYSPAYSTASPAEARRFASTVGPEFIRWARSQGLRL